MGSTSIGGDGPSFFKIIVDDILREGKLGIPRKFVKRYGSSIPNSVHLKVPGSPSWPVELSKHGKDVWFQNGWQEFVEYYSLEYGHLLVFEHHGGSSFRVFIYDQSCTEIQYPTICSMEPKQAGEQRESVEERAEDDSRARKTSSLPFSSGHKKARNDLTSQRKSVSTPPPNFRKIDSASKIPEEFVGVQPSSQKEIAASTSRMTSWKTKVVKRAQRLTCQKQSEALQRAPCLRSEHPHFMRVMRKSYVSPTVGLPIPAKFGRKYIGKRHSDVYLCVSDGRKWLTKYKRNANQSIGRLISGWERFVHDNILRVGDVCVFKLIDISEIKLRVCIFRVDDNPNIDMSLGGKICGSGPSGEGKKKKTTSENVEALQRDIAFNSDNPYFPVTLQPSYINRGVGLAIPAEFARKHLTENHSGVTLCVPNGRTWPAQYGRKGYRTAFYNGGWQEFVKDNGIKAGDLCIFELIKVVNEVKFKVFIFQGNGSMSTLSK
ncbi:B3 domain-containing transcription factor VRN1-like [Tripterygium wilfordii]|uniref:B3 domain-containing transcription factor VRN1-like n=1 Tax=Tripterygium wilfordii TaxID=458696 RepID=UPI0018F83037|nr:B3 domain-containing transcription factor VRN1-like [Tripterygium wilfordii]XP_038722802.1 B3 domain-containing transcription factor VRN1-like [Tripterygium wilfordii]XP_038722803.1 B3 domain-containing transcription factor VRN1-like [Tripterygium wilfordii]